MREYDTPPQRIWRRHPDCVEVPRWGSPRLMLAIVRLLLRASRRHFLESMVFSVVAGTSNALALASINAALNGSGRVGVALYVGLCLLALASTIAAETLLLRLSQEVLVQLRLQLARGILSAPLRALEEIGPGSMLVALTDDVTVISTAAANLPVLLTAISLLIACLAYMLWLSVNAFAWLMALLVTGLLSYFAIRGPAIRHLARARAQREGLFSKLRSLVEGVKELKLHRAKRTDFVENGIAPSANAVRRSALLGGFFFLAAGNWGYTIFFLAIGVFLFGGKWFGVEARVISGYVLTILFMRGAMESVINQMPSLGSASVSIRKLDSLGVSLHRESKDTTTLPPVRTAWKSLTLSEVIHSYYKEGAEGSFRLGPISLTLEPGKLVFLVGGNGSGKSTFAKLLTGLYAPEGGEIHLDGTVIDDSNREWYRQHFSAVFADYHLFDGVYGVGRSEQELKAGEFLKSLRLEKKVQLKDGKLSTTDLSSGQRKRLALLSAFLEDRSIYVFDEWTSDQDPIFKRFFYMDILPSLKSRGKAVLVITHDDKYFSVADSRIKLEDGQQTSEVISEFMTKIL